MTAHPVIQAHPGPPAADPPPRPSGPSLSPSRAADFKTCPLLYRFRTIDRLPERPSADQLRGTLVHAVLERLFDLPAAQRTPVAAAGLVAPTWQRLLAEQPELTELFTDADPDRGAGAADTTTAGSDRPAGTPTGVAGPGPAGTGPESCGPESCGPAEPADGQLAGLPADAVAAFLQSARGLLGGYFAVEDPRRLQPAERESLVSAMIDDELLIRGYIDRLDVSPAGDLRVVDYKTGGAPREAFEARALFQLKFYALVLWRTRGVVPRVLRLLYLKDAEVCDYSPDEVELARFERTVVALWRAIERCTAAGDFRPTPSRLCGWCSHQQLCPAFGGTPPPFPQRPAPPTVAPDPVGTGAAGTLVDAPAP